MTQISCVNAVSAVGLVVPVMEAETQRLAKMRRQSEVRKALTAAKHAVSAAQSQSQTLTGVMAGLVAWQAGRAVAGEVQHVYVLRWS